MAMAVCRGRLLSVATVLLVVAMAGPGVAGMSGQQLQTLTNAAIAAKQSVLALPEGRIEFGSVEYMIQGARDLTIVGAVDAAGIPLTELWFAFPGAVHLYNCFNFTLSNVIIDFESTYAQGSVTSWDEDNGRWFIAGFNTLMMMPDPNLEPFFAPPYNDSIKVAFWDANKTMIRNATFTDGINIFMEGSTAMGPTSPFTVLYNISVNTNIFGRIPAWTEPPMVTVMPRGGQHSLLVLNTSASLFDNVHIYGGSSMGIVESGGYGPANTFYKLNMTRRALVNENGTVDRLLAINADGFHSTSNQHAGALIQSTISFTGDDLINYCSAMLVVLASPSVTETTATLAILDNARLLEIMRPGQRITFFHLNSEAYQAQAEIVGIAESQDPDWLQRAANVRQTLTNPPYNADFTRSIFSNPGPVYAVNVTVTAGNLSNVQEYWSTAHMDPYANINPHLTQSHLHDSYSRMLMLKSSGAMVDNNVFERAGGVHLGPEQEWLEGDPGQTNVTFVHNTIINGGTNETAIQLQPCLTINKANIIMADNQIELTNE
ncbi:uncharacterized protein MONBRDRAFT_10273 [Monosiga brevicollis MX1]|uniref:Uncharacterized protein n=1 Tax=Monosiga brevicollis TaxID=81824 RepID=A9V5Q9_MONBE|nr:uncharacterized protein MONBRDRAFT_10273 [Monosiga brevicollis MX1]EDQ87161.1 predicted protein [Monosiga brevicollis MX1]|eukprot:XP_001748104.1 hypothetical protein [Monosiga brevicollis MX1]